MPLAAKIFKIKVDTSLEELADKLRDYRSVEIQKEGEEEFELLVEVRDLKIEGEHLSGIMSKDKLIYVNQRGKLRPVLKTVDARIIFSKLKDKLLLTVVQEKHFANAIASMLSQLLFLSYKAIVEANIKPETLQEFHERNPEGTKVIYFDNIDIPSVNKLALYGEALKNSPLYEEYLAHGKIWYIVFTSRRNNAVMGLTRNCVVTSFTKMPEEDFIQCIFEEVYPLIS